MKKYKVRENSILYWMLLAGIGTICGVTYGCLAIAIGSLI